MHTPVIEASDYIFKAQMFEDIKATMIFSNKKCPPTSYQAILRLVEAA